VRWKKEEGAERAARLWGSLSRGQARGNFDGEQRKPCTLATLRGAQHVKNSQKQKHAADRHLIRCSPFFVLHNDEASRSRSRLSQNYQRGFEDEASKKSYFHI
jgi:hypothetical protein